MWLKAPRGAGFKIAVSAMTVARYRRGGRSVLLKLKSKYPMKRYKTVADGRPGRKSHTVKIIPCLREAVLWGRTYQSKRGATGRSLKAEQKRSRTGKTQRKKRVRIHRRI